MNGSRLNEIQDSLKILKQCIVQVARNAQTFIDARLQTDAELVAQLLKTELIDRPQQGEKKKGASGAEPGCLKPGRRNKKFQSRTGIVPNSVVVGRNYAESICAWFQVVV